MTTKDYDIIVKDACSKPSYKDAQPLEGLLYLYGMEYPGDVSAIKEDIARIREHFGEQEDKAKVEAEKKKLDEMTEQVLARVAKQYGLPNLNVTDEQVAQAIIAIQDEMKGASDWYAIYIVLSCKCGYPKVLTEFALRISQLIFPGALFYPCDYKAGSADKGGSFYQGLKNGRKNSWPVEYDEWQTYNPVEKKEVFKQRKKIADLLYEKLKPKG